jgi:hypothetical protein
MDLPPILKLPVELRYLIYSFATDEQQWFTPDSKQIKPFPLGQNRFGQRHFRDNSDAGLFQRHRAFLTTNTSDPNKAQLTCAHPLARVNRSLRVEVSEFLRTSSMPVVARVRDFDFSHVQCFLSTLEEVQQDTFKVRHDSTSGRSLTIELQAPYKPSRLDNLRSWINFIDAFVGSEKKAEFCALYKTVDIDNPMRTAITTIVLPPSKYFDADLFEYLPIAALKDVEKDRARIAPGGARIELNKIVATLTTWLEVHWV